MRSMATPMTLEGCAEMRAEMEAGQLRDAVLSRAGLGVEEWSAVQTEWLEKMSAEIERGRFELTSRYSQAFIARQRALRAITPDAIDAPAEPAPSTIEVPLRHAVVAQASVPVVSEMPSFLVPVAPPLAEPIAAPSPSPARPRVPSQLAETSLGFVAPTGAALPFARAPVALPPEATAAPPRPVVNRAPAALSGTSMGFIAPKGDMLPFAKAHAPLPPPPAPTPPGAAPVPAAPAAGSVIVGGYTLEQHVSLCAEITVDPTRVAETLTRYRITAEGKTELDRLWQERFDADPALAVRWREAHGMYLTFLRTRRV